MPNRCVAGNCSNVPDPSKNIKLHKFPKQHETRRRRLWINFVHVKHAKWTFTPTSHLCSEHFSPQDFESQFSAIPGTSFVGWQSLKNDAIPTIQKTQEEERQGQTSSSSREQCCVNSLLIVFFSSLSQPKCDFIIDVCVGCIELFKRECKLAFWGANFPSAFHHWRNQPTWL